MTARVRHFAGRLEGLVYENAVRFGLASYRRPFNSEPEAWDSGYLVGEHDHYDSLGERARYGILQGYISARANSLDILDVGCGVGLMRGRIADEKIACYVGCDPSKVAIDQARNAGWPRSDFYVAATPALEPGRFDIIICNEMLYYVEDVDALLARLDQLLKPDGWLLSSITRHMADFTLHRKLDGHFKLLDSLTVKSNVGHRKWRLSCHAKRAGA